MVESAVSSGWSTSMVWAIAGRTSPKARGSRASLPQIAQGVRRRTDFEPGAWAGVWAVGADGSMPCSLMALSRSTWSPAGLLAHVLEKWLPVSRKRTFAAQESCATQEPRRHLDSVQSRPALVASGGRSKHCREPGSTASNQALGLDDAGGRPRGAAHVMAVRQREVFARAHLEQA